MRQKQFNEKLIQLKIFTLASQEKQKAKRSLILDFLKLRRR